MAYTHSLTKQKLFGSYLSLYFSTFHLRHCLTKMIFKIHWKNSTHLSFRWLTKSIETMKLYKRSFYRCYSLCFYTSLFLVNEIGIIWSSRTTPEFINYQLWTSYKYGASFWQKLITFIHINFNFCTTSKYFSSGTKLF